MRILISILLLFAAGEINAQSIPSSKLTDWSHAGYVPANATDVIILNVKNFGASGNGTTDDQHAVMNAMLSLQGRAGIIFFPEGTYFFKSGIELPDSVVLKGASASSTLLRFDLGSTGAHCIEMKGKNDNAYTKILGGPARGTTEISVENSSGFSAGDFAEIRESNGSWDTNPAGYAKNVVGQMVRIKSVSGDMLILDEALRIDYDTTLGPEISRVIPRVNAGLACLSIERIDTPGIEAGHNIYLSYASLCAISGIESNKSQGSHLMVEYSSHIQIENSYFHDAFSWDGTGTRGYGVTLRQHSGECLVENNIFRNLRHAMMVKEGANGNVFAYNYSTEVHRSETPSNASGDISLHGHFAFSNLFEGNIVQNIIIDHFWGPSGPGNTFYRNRAELYGIIMTDAPLISNEQIFVGNEVTGKGLLYGKYILKGTGHYEYANNVNGTVFPAGSLTLTELSCFLGGKPAFWKSTANWPGIGFPNAINSQANPAKERYSSGTGLAFCESKAVVPTGLSDKSANRDLLVQHIAPNPFTDQISISLFSEKERKLTISISDISGKQLLMQQVQATTGEQQLIFQVPGELSAGLYLLKIQSAENVQVFKLCR